MAKKMLKLLPGLLLFASLASANELPGTWYGFGFAASPNSAPIGATWLSVAKAVAPKQDLYNYTTLDVSATPDIRTGVASAFGLGRNLYGIVFSNAGIQKAGTGVTGSLALGSMLMYNFHGDLTIELGARLNYIPPSAVGARVTPAEMRPVIEIGLGHLIKDNK